jgi:hypothetical protein
MGSRSTKEGIPLRLSILHHVRLLVTALVTVIATSACGGGQDSPPSPPAPPPPQQPTVQTTTFQGTEDQALVASLGAKDPAGLALTIVLDTAPAHGTLTAPDSAGAFTYQPAKDFSGTDSFHVQVTNTAGASTNASVTIKIVHVSNPPVTAADNARTAPGVAVTIPVLANDTDPKSHPLTPQIVTQSQQGNAVVNPDGTITFTPATGFAGTATFVYQDTNTEGDISPQTNVQVQVRPLQKAAYLTIAQRIFFDDTNSVTAITSPTNAGSPLGFSLSRNGRTLLYSTTGVTSGTGWYAADLQGSLAGQSVAATGSGIGTGSVVLSDDGTMALYPVDGLAGYYTSTELFLLPLYTGGAAKINAGTFSTEQVDHYFFGNRDRNIYYVSHSVTTGAKSILYLETFGSLGAATQLSPMPGDNDSILEPVRSNDSATQFVYLASRGSTLGLYAVNTASPGSETLLGPTTAWASTTATVNITGFDIAPQGHFGAYVEQWTVAPTTGPAYAFLVDLDHPGSYATIGTGFATGTKLSTPLFSPDGQNILLWVNTGPGLALFELSVTQPTALVQMSPLYATTSSIPVFQYTPDGQDIIYTVDATTAGTYDLYSIHRSKPGVAVQLNQPLGTSLYGPFISISPDSTTVAYVQPETSGGTLSLFLVDRTTPGMPFKQAANIAPAPVQLQPQPFYIVP